MFKINPIVAAVMVALYILILFFGEVKVLSPEFIVCNTFWVVLALMALLDRYQLKVKYKREIEDLKYRMANPELFKNEKAV